MFSRRAGVAGNAITPAPDRDRPMAQAVASLGGVPVAILGYHATRPAPAANYHWQAEGIEALAFWSRSYEMAGAQRVAIGDFNATSQGAHARRLGEAGGLRDARLGRGLHGTWPSHLPAVLRVPIDGAYISDGLIVTSVATGPNVGSDHLPILVTLGVRPGFTAAPAVPMVGAASPRSPTPAATSPSSWPR